MLRTALRNLSRNIAFALLVCGQVCGLNGEPIGNAPAHFITSLERGEPRSIVIYGTSLSKGGGWVLQMKEALDQRFPGLVTLTNMAKGGQNSKWGIGNLQERVLSLEPDVVFLEFAINDAAVRSHMTLQESRANLELMIDRISTALPACEIILQVMSPVVGVPDDAPNARRNQEAYHQIYRDVASKRKLRLIDHTAAWQKLLKQEGEAGFRRYAQDGVHPNADAYRQFVTPVILASIGLKPERFGAAFFHPEWMLQRKTE